MSFFGVMSALGLPSSLSCERIEFGMPKAICDPVLVWFYLIHFKICLIPGNKHVSASLITMQYRCGPKMHLPLPHCVFRNWPEDAEL